MKKLFLPASLALFAFMVSCNKQSKVATAPKPQMHTLTVTRANGSVLRLPIAAEQDATLLVSQKEDLITITKADGTVQIIPFKPDENLNPKILNGLQKRINELQVKSGNWQDAAAYLQTDYKRNL